MKKVSRSGRAGEPTTPSCDELLIALEESIRLQSHYASLLNQYDLGRRIVFPNVQSWLDRLHETKTLPRRISVPV